MERPQSESGFILIAAIWLLILGGSIAALLLLRAQSASVKATAAEDMLAGTLAIDAAVETVIMDVLVNGSRSQWAILPATGHVSIEDAQLDVRITSELGRVDLNEAEIKIIEQALARYQVSPAAAGRLKVTLLRRRGENRPLRSWSEVEAILPRSGCLAEHFTIFSGLAVPQRASGPDNYGTDRGMAPEMPSSELTGGTPLRIEINSRKGSATIWTRLTGRPGEPRKTFAYRRSRLCF